MNITKLKSLPVISAALLLSSMTTAQANESGVYIGAGMGSYSIDVNNLDQNDDVIKALIGMQFNDMFGVEASLTDFDRVNNGGDRFEGDGHGLAAVLSFPVGEASALFVKGGQFWWDTDASFSNTSQSSNGNDPFWGAGFKFGFTEALALRLEAERYDVINTHIKTFTLGVDYRF